MQRGMFSFAVKRDVAVLAMVTAIGLALRIAGAQGGLWLDEAWSAVHAEDAATPLGIFLGIHHDNNHHLNSLWMQAVGLEAPPLLQRGLAIASGVASIVVAAMIAAPRGRMATVATALLFAFSPILVTLGSEARGYAPMVLALLIAILFVDRWLNGNAPYRRPATLALAFALGLLAQLTMLFGICAIIGWAMFVLARRHGPGVAIGETARMFAPALAASAAVLALIFGAAAASDEGFRFGSYTPFDATDMLQAIVQMLGFTFGFDWIAVWPIAIALALLVLSTRAAGDQSAFYWLSVVGFPLGLIVLQVGNVGYPRYYLTAGIALLLAAGVAFGAAVRARGLVRLIAIASIAAFTVGAVVQDMRLIRERRGNPDAAIAAMVARSPQGTRVAIERGIGTAMIEAAARRMGYPVEISDGACDLRAEFVFLDRYRGEPRALKLARCGHRYRAIVYAEPTGLSGTHWTLYHLAP